MTVSRAFKRGTRASLRPTSRARRVEWNAKLAENTRTFVPQPVPAWTPIRLGVRPEPEPEQEKPDYETEIVGVTNVIGVREFHEITRNRRSTVFDGWLYDDETFFERRHIRVIEHARELWRAVSMHAATSIDVGNFGTQGLVIERDDELAARAVNLLRRARSLVPRWQWDVFENVVRWNEPYGFPGSSLFSEKPARIERTKFVVRATAETIARSLFL